MNYYTTPGVYIEQSPKKIESIRISKRCLVGFIGIAEKGPIHEPVKVTNFQQFTDIFGGFINYAYLAYSVFGFFNTGGRECIIVRTAHMRNKKDNAGQNDHAATKAYLSVPDPENKEALTATATSEGTWGNGIQIKIWYAPDVTAKVSKSVKAGSATIDVQSVSDMRPGDTVCIYTINKKEYKEILTIEGNKLTLSSPVSNDYDPEKEQVFCEKIFVNVFISNKKKVEEYLYLSPNRKDKDYYITEVNRRSLLIRLEKKNEQAIPTEVYYKNLNNGENGIMGITPADFIGFFKGLNDFTGIGIFEANDDINLLVCPDLHIFQEIVYKEKDKNLALDSIFAVQSAMIDQCEKLGNRFVILDSPIIENPIELIKWRDRFDSKFAAIYYPRIEMINPEDVRGLTSLLVPPSGHIAGTYVDCDIKEGVFRAPANRFIIGIAGVERRIENDEYEILYPKGINCIKFLPGRGVKVWGARTLSSNPDWRYINVRRTYSAIRDSLKRGTGWAVFEPNSESLRKHLVRHVSAFLLDLWREGYMRGATPEEGFFVRCDDELNPPEQIDNGIIQVAVGLSIARPAEFLIVKISANSEDGMVLTEE